MLILSRMALQDDMVSPIELGSTSSTSSPAGSSLYPYEVRGMSLSPATPCVLIPSRPHSLGLTSSDSPSRPNSRPTLTSPNTGVTYPARPCETSRSSMDQSPHPLLKSGTAIGGSYPPSPKTVPTLPHLRCPFHHPSPHSYSADFPRALSPTPLSFR